MNENARFFSESLQSHDPVIASEIALELRRQQTQIELIASENIVSAAVMEAQGTVLTNKYAEGYPGRRYYGGCEHVDRIEALAIDRVRALFLAEAGESIERFFSSGVLELKDKLGPVNWQFATTKQFDADDFEAFLALLPKRVEGRVMRHAVEVRHESFRDKAFVALARKYGVAIVMAGDSDYPQIADVTAPFVYARIMGTQEKHRLGYPKKQLDLWTQRAREWAAGGVPDGLETVTKDAKQTPRDVFLYVISGYKTLNPAAAIAMIKQLSEASK